eukprot:scaffold372754_cov56-Prasinocladus_malaysianus.AAC.1
MDARLVCECVGAHDGLMWLDRHPAVLRHHAADGPDVHRVDAGPQPAHLILPVGCVTWLGQKKNGSA